MGTGEGDWIWIQTDVGLNLGSAPGSLGDLTSPCISLGLSFLFHKIELLLGKIVVSMK